MCVASDCECCSLMAHRGCPFHCALTRRVYLRNIHFPFLLYAVYALRKTMFFSPFPRALRAHFSFGLRRHNVRSNLNMGDQQQQPFV